MMKWVWRLGTFSGIGVYIHATFLLIIAWVGFSSWQQTRAFSGAVESVVFTLVLFGTVVLHEFGHALTARRYGIKTRDITLYPIGGVARLEHMPEKPIQEFWVALAGPAVNVGIAVFLYVWLSISNTFIPLSSITVTTGPFVERLLMINIFLVLFNMIPAFPMDGGRVLRSLLALRMEYPRATQLAATIGRGMAILFALVGLFTNPFLVLIAFFVYFGASQEASMVQMKAALSGVPVERAMITDYHTLSPTDQLARLSRLILSSSQTAFPVVQSDGVIGMVTRDQILAALTRQGQEAVVSDIMRREFPVVNPDETLESVFIHLQTNEFQPVPVIYQDQLVGLLTMQSIADFLNIQAALSRTPSKEQALQLEARNFGYE
jgi:Zn-dependent protease/predicted transcriptional regulator